MLPGLSEFTKRKASDQQGHTQNPLLFCLRFSHHLIFSVFECEPCEAVAVPSRAARPLGGDEAPFSPGPGSCLSARRGSLCRWSTCWWGSSLCMCTEWTASTFPPREQVQIVTVQVFMSFCVFPNHFTLSAECPHGVLPGHCRGRV